MHKISAGTKWGSIGVLTLGTAWVVCTVAAEPVGLSEPPAVRPAHELSVAGGIRFDAGRRRLSADLQDWSLKRVLEHLAVATRWRIRVEPGLDRRVSARFDDAPLGVAFRRLFGSLNYAWVPGGREPARLLVFDSDVSAATTAVPGAPPETTAGSSRIEDELIVRVPAEGVRDIDALARRLGGKVIGRLEKFGAYQLKFETSEAAQAAREQLAAEGVLQVEDNYRLARPADPNTRLMAAMPALNLRPRRVSRGEEIVVAVVDTPVQTEGTVLKDFLLPAIQVAGEADPPADHLTHGTSMATTILNGVAASATAAEGTPVRILPVDIYGPHESSTSFALAQGISAAIEAGAEVINLSLGSEAASPIVHQVIQAGHAQGVIFVAAAGNEPVETPTYPAAYPEVVAVTAADRGGEVAPYANRGDFVDLLAPGLSLVPFHGQPYYVIGTSAAAANTTGQAANLIVGQGLRGAALEEAIRKAEFPEAQSSAAP